MTTDKRKEQNKESQATFRAKKKSEIQELIDVVKAMIKQLKGQNNERS